MTQAERAIWDMLRKAFEGAHFRRQVPIRHFIVDFASHPAKLVIEIDGGQHDAEADLPRTNIIEAEGYKIVRFWNNDVLGNLDGVYTVIAGVLREPHPHPTLPHHGGGPKRRGLRR